MKIAGLTQNTQKWEMGFSGAWDLSGNQNPGAPIGEKRKTLLDNYLHANFETNGSSPSTQKEQTLRSADSPVFRAPRVDRSKNANIVLCTMVFLHSFGEKDTKIALLRPWGKIKS